MTTICCSTGKARVYYIKPGKGGLKYKRKGQTKWETITADEKLVHECVENNRTEGIWLNWTDGDGLPQETLLQSGLNEPPETTVSNWRLEWASMGAYNANVWFCDITDALGTRSVRTICGDMACSPYVRSMSQPSPKIIREDTPKFTFRIKGESGKVYLSLELEECPVVQTVDCIFDEKNTKYRDVEMAYNDRIKTCIVIGYPGDKLPFPGAGSTSDEYYVVPNNLVMVFKTAVINPDAIYPGRPPISPPPVVGVLNLEVKKPCPPPKVWIECCPNGICGEDKKCPKETVCQIDCEGFRCCYDGKGKLIKKIKL
jgi:hypothetical protein